MPSQEKWERYVKICGAAAAIATILGVLFGGGFGLYTYYQQGERELALMEYNLKKDAYYELVDAAISVAFCEIKEDAIREADKFNILFLGRAHLFVVDHNVEEAKRMFYGEMDAALKPDARWSESMHTLRERAVELRDACRKALNIEEIFSNNE